MAKIYVFMADGFEDIEALAPIDILRRGGMDVTTVSINDTLEVESAHRVTILADTVFEAADFSDADLLVLPGGMPGAANLDNHEALGELIVEHNAQGKYLAAICAAPLVYGRRGILQGKRATCYPGFEKYLDGAEYTRELVTTDGNIITADGPGAAMPFGYTLLSLFADEQTVNGLKDGMMFTQLMTS